MGLQAGAPRILALLLGVIIPALSAFSGHNKSEDTPYQSLCQPGYYCPGGGGRALPCPRGTFGVEQGATSVERCVSCPPHHYGPREGMSVCVPCGAGAHQPSPGQDECVCQGEGQSFQPSDGQCVCMLGFEMSGEGGLCVQKVYDLCRDGFTRTQHGDCMNTHMWRKHCAHLVCETPEDYLDYEASLGVCVCAGRAERQGVCGDWCRQRRHAPPLRLRCSGGHRVLIHKGRQLRVSGSVLEGVLDPHGELRCRTSPHLSSSIYAVHTDEAGFFGLFSSVTPEVASLLLDDTGGPHNNSESLDTHTHADTQPLAGQPVHTESIGGLLWSGGGPRVWRRQSNSSSLGVLNPTTCLQLGDILLFTVTKDHYPRYDIDSLFNTNAGFDWGSLRKLAQDLKGSGPSIGPSLFAMRFSEPGVYVFNLHNNPHKHMYVKVMPAGGQCYESGPFFPATSQHLTRMGVAKQRHLLLRPDWALIGGLMGGACVLLALCIALLVLFREYGWPEKVGSPARYRLQQLRYRMDDYSSKGSRILALQKKHRSLQITLTQTSMGKDEFWDYEEQVDLEAFSTSTFYDILLKHSVSVTARLAQLRGEVKELYQGVVCKVQSLTFISGSVEGRGMMAMDGSMGQTEPVCSGESRMQREVEREVARRRALAERLCQLLDAQLHTLQQELQCQQHTHRTLRAQLRSCLRMLAQATDSPQPLSVLQCVSVVAEELCELVSGECQRQGAWAVLKEGTGARLLCPHTGSTLSRDDIIAADGSVRASGAVHVDSVTGLVLPNPGVHMLLSNGHTMAAPPDFFLHPHTARLLPAAGNVAFDTHTSTLVFTADACLGDVGKFEAPLLPYVPYPSTRPGEPVSGCGLRGLRPGQRLVLGGPMCDRDTGVLVPILGVTIHPHTGLVYPLGGVHTCPITRLQQPIQLGGPMLDPRTGSLALITGVTLHPNTVAVLPVGGVLLGESFIEPLSGRMVRVGGASMRGGKLVPHAGGFQAQLEAQALVAGLRAVQLLQGMCEGQGGARSLQREVGRLREAAGQLEQAWRCSLHCGLQLCARLEVMHAWALGVTRDGGSIGEMQPPGSDQTLPALPGLEYPDPGGSGLSVPVLGAQLDWHTGRMVPLAGTMEDAEGKGLVPIRLGAQTVDPVTGSLSAVVGVRLDAIKKTVVPLTISHYMSRADNADTVQLEVLQKEVCVRMCYWRQQRHKEEELLGDLEAALRHLLSDDTQTVQWVECEQQLREVVQELQESAQTETQRRHTHASETLTHLLPPHTLNILTKVDEEEWEQQCVWQRELVSGLNRISVCVQRMRQEQEESKAHHHTHQTAGLERRRDVWEQLSGLQSQLEAAFISLLCTRELAQIRAETAQAMLAGSFWYSDLGVSAVRAPPNPLRALALSQMKILPHLERLLQHLEDTPQHQQHGSGLSIKQALGIDSCSREWTASVSVVKGVSCQSLKEQCKPRPPDEQDSPLAKEERQEKTPTNPNTDLLPVKDCSLSGQPSIPVLTEGEWARVLELSPLFQLLCGLEQQLRSRAKQIGLFKGEDSIAVDRGRAYLDFLDAQWECEGQLVAVSMENLNTREYLTYQHGLFLLRTLHTHKLVPQVTLQMASSLPRNTYHQNAFRHSFYYQEEEKTLYVRMQRLQSVGGFSLVLLHCLAHIACGDMHSDTSHTFTRTFFKALQVCLGQLFHSRLAAVPSSGADPTTATGGAVDTSSPLTDSLLCRAHRSAGDNRVDNETLGIFQKHRQAAMFLQIEGLLQGKTLEGLAPDPDPDPAS